MDALLGAVGAVGEPVEGEAGEGDGLVGMLRAPHSAPARRGQDSLQFLHERRHVLSHGFPHLVLIDLEVHVNEAASSICWIRTRSSSGILLLALGKDVLTEVPAEFGRSSQVHLPPEHFRQLQLQPRHAEESGGLPRLELDEKVDITVGSEVASEDRAKERESANSVPPAEARESPPGYFNAVVRQA